MASLAAIGQADGWRRGNEIDDLLLRIKGLVFARAILEERGVDAAAVEEHARELERLRKRLARRVAQTAA
jgi:hypothetical protein